MYFNRQSLKVAGGSSVFSSLAKASLCSPPLTPLQTMEMWLGSVTIPCSPVLCGCPHSFFGVHVQRTTSAQGGRITERYTCQFAKPHNSTSHHIMSHQTTLRTGVGSRMLIHSYLTLRHLPFFALCCVMPRFVALCHACFFLEPLC